MEIVSVLMFTPLGSSTGLLNEAPTADHQRQQHRPDQIHRASRSIPAATSTWRTRNAPSCVCLSADWKQHRDCSTRLPQPPSAGATPGLTTRDGIALDSSGNIYAANDGANITVYPPLGSSTGTLNEAPTATISERQPVSVRHRAGFQRQHLRGERVQLPSQCVDVSSAGEQRRHNQ